MQQFVRTNRYCSACGAVVEVTPYKLLGGMCVLMDKSFHTVEVVNARDIER